MKHGIGAHAFQQKGTSEGTNATAHLRDASISAEAQLVCPNVEARRGYDLFRYATQYRTFINNLQLFKTTDFINLPQYPWSPYYQLVISSRKYSGLRA